MDTKPNALSTAFDRLFDKAVTKLQIEVTPQEKDEATRQFEERFKDAIRLIDAVHPDAFPDKALDQMESSIDELTPAQIAGYLAYGPLVLQVQDVQRRVALRAAQEKLLEHVISQADDTYGGN